MGCIPSKSNYNNISSKKGKRTKEKKKGDEQRKRTKGANKGDVDNLFRQSCQNKKKNVEF